MKKLKLILGAFALFSAMFIIFLFEISSGNKPECHIDEMGSVDEACPGELYCNEATLNERTGKAECHTYQQCVDSGAPSTGGPDYRPRTCFAGI